MYNYQKSTLEINSIIKFVSSYIAEINLYLSYNSKCLIYYIFSSNI